MMSVVHEIYTSGVRLQNGCLISWEDFDNYFARQRHKAINPLFDFDPRDIIAVGGRVWYDGYIDGSIHILEYYNPHSIPVR